MNRTPQKKKRTPKKITPRQGHEPFAVSQLHRQRAYQKKRATPTKTPNSGKASAAYCEECKTYIPIRSFANHQMAIHGVVPPPRRDLSGLGYWGFAHM